VPRADRPALPESSLLKLNAGERTRLTTAPAPTTDQFPAVSPDGIASVSALRRHVFARHLCRRHTAVRRARLPSITTPSTVLPGTPMPRDCLSPRPPSGGGLWRVPARGGRLQRVLVTGKVQSAPAISRTGISSQDGNFTDSNVWRADWHRFHHRLASREFGSHAPPLAFPREDHSRSSPRMAAALIFASGRTAARICGSANRMAAT